MKIPKSIQFSLFFSIGLFVFSLNSCKHKESKELYPSFQIPETRDTFHYKVSEIIRRFPDFSQDLRIYKFKASYFGKNKELFYPNFFSENLIDHILDNSLVKTDNKKRQLLKTYKKRHYKYVHDKYNENINNNSISIVLGKHIKKDSVYEVFIFNCSNEKKAIGYRSNINLLLEIKLFDCIWFALNETPSSDCGQSNNLLLNEKEICLTYLPELKKGNFKTQFRLRLRNAYSESYSVSIDESILENIEN